MQEEYITIRIPSTMVVRPLTLQEYLPEFKAVIQSVDHPLVVSFPALLEPLAMALYTCLTVFEEGVHSMPPHLDQAWHAVILNTRLYHDFCHSLGRTVHHTTDTMKQDTVDVKNARVFVLEKAFLAAGGQLELMVWARERALRNKEIRRPRIITVTIKTLDGVEKQHRCMPTLTVRGLKLQAGLNPDEYRIIFAGRQLEDSLMLNEYKLRDGHTLHAIGRLRGC